MSNYIQRLQLVSNIIKIKEIIKQSLIKYLVLKPLRVYIKGNIQQEAMD